MIVAKDSLKVECKFYLYDFGLFVDKYKRFIHVGSLKDSIRVFSLYNLLLFLEVIGERILYIADGSILSIISYSYTLYPALNSVGNL